MACKYNTAVALATYNGERYITHMLSSLFCQTVLPDQVIIVDDCSTDGTAEAVRTYIAENGLDWNFSVSKKNEGYKKNFKKCLEKTDAELVFLCDQDDLWAPDKIETVMRFFEDNPACTGLNTGFDCIDEIGNRINRRQIAETGEVRCVTAAEVIKRNISPGCTACFRSSVIKQYVNSTDSIMPHDWELNIISANNGGLFYYDKILTHYRLHENNAIGIETGTPALKIRGTAEKRTEILEIQRKRADFLRNADEKLAKKFLMFTENRKISLTEGKILPSLKNLFYLGPLKGFESVTLRSVAGDLLLAIGKGKK